MKTTRLILLCICAMLFCPFTMQAQERWLEGYKKVLVIGAHPDDPETMCGGTMIKLREMGVEFVSVYLTGGEAGIPGKTHEESRTIRTAEAQKACEAMGVRAVFLTQIDGNTEVNKARYAEMKALIEAEQPDLVITHWPIDSHRDHRVCSILVYDAWRQTKYSFDLFYGEVMTGLQTQTFAPNHWVNISQQHDQKVKAYYCHQSQDMPVVQEWHDAMEILRGMECHTKYAEAFVKQVWTE